MYCSVPNTDPWGMCAPSDNGFFSLCGIELGLVRSSGVLPSASAVTAGEAGEAEVLDELLVSITGGPDSLLSGLFMALADRGPPHRESR